MPPRKKPVSDASSNPMLQSIPLSFDSPESSTLLRAVYDPTTLVLEVIFKHQLMAYRYFEVPVLVWEGFLRAKSRGQFFQQRIRPLFTSERVA